MTDVSVHVNPDKVRSLIAGIFSHFGVPPNDALVAADVLVRADLRGVSSHGVNNMFQYVEPLRDGTLNPRPHITLVRDSPVTALIDGDGGMGLVVGVRAMELCIAKAAEQGLGAVAVRRSKHYGMASYFALMCLPHDMIGLSLTCNYAPGVVPTFGKQAMMGTNPISIVAPAGREAPFELDMATSVAAMSKIGLALATGKDRVPLGWALDGEGHPTDHAQSAWEARRMLPLGGTRELGSHKGYGLGVAVDILTALLAGGMYGDLFYRNPPEDVKLRYSSSHFFAALRVDCFRPVDEFKAAMDDMLRALKQSEKADGHERIYTAGEIEHEAEQDRLQNGIPYHPNFIEELRRLADEAGVPFDLT
jgi:LDH2 family malate/lactate/ureidoglycolate dehydrogenase